MSEHADANVVVESFRRWIYAMAYTITASHPADLDDVAQEGAIAIWRAVHTYDPTKGSLASWVTTAAKQRMRNVVGRGQWTGHEPVRGFEEAERVLYDPADIEGDPETLLDGMELAYHHGEIMMAIASLPPAQQRYVIARFWGGVDPLGRTASDAQARRAEPVLTRSYLWKGAGAARDRLARALSHLDDRRVS